jgi:protein-tyrosine phosphatase
VGDVATEESTVLTIDGLVNVRELGGLPTESGGTTRRGRLLRSDSPHSLSAEGREALLALGVSTVVDLRTASERESRPSPFSDIGGMRAVHAPIFTDDDEFPAGLVTAADVYGWWLRELGGAVAVAMAAIADAPEAPVLVHCHAGKDRTGVVVALVLRLAGVTVDAVADDYAQSGVQLADMLARDRVSAVERGMDEMLAERLFTVRREAMVETAQRIDEEHGGAAELLRAIGLDATRVDRLRRLLLAPAWP